MKTTGLLLLVTVTTLCLSLTSAGNDCHVISGTRDLTNTLTQHFDGDWRALAVELGTNETQDAKQRSRKVLEAWFGSQATPCWENITAALRSTAVGMDSLAKRIEKCLASCGEDSIVVYCLNNNGRCIKNPLQDRSEL